MGEHRTSPATPGKAGTPDKPMTTGSQWWWSHPRQLLRYVLSLDDTPHHIAAGAAIGMFVGLTPTPGVQMLLVLGVYYSVRRFLPFCLPAGLAATYASNPLTALPLAWVSYQTGRLFVGGDLTWDEIAALMRHDAGDLFHAAVGVAAELGWAYLIGSLVVAAVGACVTYPAMRILLHLVRKEPPAGGSGTPLADGPEPHLTEQAGCR